MLLNKETNQDRNVLFSFENFAFHFWNSLTPEIMTNAIDEA